MVSFILFYLVPFSVSPKAEPYPHSPGCHLPSSSNPLVSVIHSPEVTGKGEIIPNLVLESQPNKVFAVWGHAL